MTIHACGQWTWTSHDRDLCVGCKGLKCRCPGCDNGMHYDPGAKSQAKQVNKAFVDDRKTPKEWAKR